jgi:hypothetical protein
MQFRPWTPDEDARLVALSRAGHTATAIAQIVGNRSVGACRDRLQRLQAGMLGVWSGAVCYCGRPAVAKDRCHNHYAQMMQKRQRGEDGRYEKAAA